MSTNPYPSGEFNPNVDARPYGNAAVIFDGDLWVIGGTGSSGDISQTTGPANDPTTWTTTSLSISQFKPQTLARCAAAVSTGQAPGLYLFWSQADSGTRDLSSKLMVSQYYSDPSTGVPGWHAPLVLCGADSNSPIVGSTFAADVNATPFGGNTFIISCGSAVPSSSEEACIFLGVYETSQIDTANGTWPASSQYYLSLSTAQGLLAPIWKGLELEGIAGPVSLAWFSALGTDDGTGPAQLQFYLMVFFQAAFASSHGAARTCCLLVPLDSSGAPQTTFPFQISVVGYGGASEDEAAPLSQSADTPTASAALLDPAGRVWTYCSWNAYVFAQTYYTNVLPRTSGYPIATASQVLPAEGANSLVPPAVVFFTDMSSAPSPCSSGEAQDSYPVYQLLFYGSSPVLCQATFFGTVEVLCNYANYTPLPAGSPAANLPGGTSTYIVTGSIDGPIPAPNQNIYGYQFEDTVNDVGDVTYGYTQSEEQQHQTSFSWTGGIQTEGEVSQGVGLAWDVSMSAGPTSVWGGSTGTSQSLSKTQSSNVDTTVQKVGTAIMPLGNLFVAAANIQAIAYKFVDASGNPITDATTDAPGQAPKCVMLQTFLIDGAPQNYTPFMVTPGDLSSYTAEAIHTTMQSLGYSGVDYVNEVIVPNAYIFPNGTNYLPFSWSADGNSESQFEANSTTFTENGWTFDDSVYVGFSAGGGVSIFGMGEEATFKLLVGLSVSYSTQSTTTQGQQWGINLGGSDGWGPPSWGDNTSNNKMRNNPNWGSAIQNYSFDLYFLPVPTSSSGLPPNYWTQELITYIRKVPNQAFPQSSVIDPYSSSWRIVYVVTDFVTNNDYYNLGKTHTYKYQRPSK